MWRAVSAHPHSSCSIRISLDSVITAGGMAQGSLDYGPAVVIRRLDAGGSEPGVPS